jgi:hypothetical protein
MNSTSFKREAKQFFDQTLELLNCSVYNFAFILSVLDSIPPLIASLVNHIEIPVLKELFICYHNLTQISFNRKNKNDNQEVQERFRIAYKGFTAIYEALPDEHHFNSYFNADPEQIPKESDFYADFLILKMLRPLKDHFAAFGTIQSKFAEQILNFFQVLQKKLTSRRPKRNLFTVYLRKTCFIRFLIRLTKSHDVLIRPNAKDRLNWFASL